MTNVISFPRPKQPSPPALVQVGPLTEDAFDALIGVLRPHLPPNADLFRDLAMIKMLVHAALIRQTGSANHFTRLLDDIFAGHAPE
jgi:hypothetical protein